MTSHFPQAHIQFSTHWLDLTVCACLDHKVAHPRRAARIWMWVHRRLYIYPMWCRYLPWCRIPYTRHLIPPAIGPGWDYSRQPISARGHIPCQLPREYTGVLRRGAQTYCWDQDLYHGKTISIPHILPVGFSLKRVI